MNWPYVHTLINHFPIILVVMGAAAAVAAITYTSVLGGRIVHDSPKLTAPPPGVVMDTARRG